jgi:hypothetical protein
VPGANRQDYVDVAPVIRKDHSIMYEDIVTRADELQRRINQIMVRL